MFKVCGIIEVTKIEFFNYSRTERVSKIKKKKKETLKTSQACKTITFQAIPANAKFYFGFSLKIQPFHSL